MIGAFVTGLLGSLHCLGMCGPLAMALPGQQKTSKTAYFLGRLAYNSGRIFTYSILGGLVSLIGVAANMFRIQQYVSIGLGAVLVFMAIRTLVRHRRKARQQSVLDRWVYKRFSYFAQNPVPGRLFVLGALNGLLPCGLVYLGLFQAALTSNLWWGMATMAAFGLGTLPLMMGLSLSGQWLKRMLQGRARFVLPSLMLVLGLMLGLRGMALGIPYLSPRMEVNETGQTEVICHTPGEAPPNPSSSQGSPAHPDTE